MLSEDTLFEIHNHQLHENEGATVCDTPQKFCIRLEDACQPCKTEYEKWIKSQTG